MYKINNNGDFLEYPGTTIISSIQPKDSSLWKCLFQFLQSSPLITDFYSLLPYDSYHMTICSLYNKFNRTALDWNNFISKNLQLFQQLGMYCQEISLTPRITILNSLVTKHVLQLNFSIPQEQITVMHNLLKSFNLENGLPNTFHMTLAYQKPNKTISSLEHTTIKKLVLSEVKKIFIQEELTLLPPTLCYFKDMTKFTPWDGRTNPFLKEPQNLPFFRHYEQQDNNTSYTNTLAKRF